MFAKLLNVVRRWFSAPRKPEQPSPGPPAQWLKLRDPGPPEHWLEAARRAGPMTRIVAEDGLENPTAQTWPAQPQTANEDASPKHGGSRRVPACADEPRTRVRKLESSFFEERVQEILQKADESRKSAVARLFRKPGSETKPVALETASAPAPGQELATEKPVQPRPELPSKSANETKWPRWFNKKTPSGPSTFPTEPGQKHSPAFLRYPEQVRSFPSLEMVYGDTLNREEPADRRVATSNFESADASNPALSRSSGRAEGWKGNPEVTDPSPTLWPDLPQSDQVTSATLWRELPDSEVFAATGFFSQPVARPVASRFPETMPNSWPSLAPEPVTTDFNRRSLIRSLQRSQRLEKEQRGY